MARARIPARYGIFQFCLRLLVFVVEIWALAALVTLSKYGEHYALGYVATCLGLALEMLEMLALANPAHHIRRVPSGGLCLADFVVFAVGLVAFFMFVFRDRDVLGRHRRPTEEEIWAHDHDPHRVEKDTWTPWYVWLQLTAGVLHFLYMIMHCIDTCRR